MHKWFGKKGFTIPELLIVITVIAILAAIVLVSYNGIQKRGQDAAVQSDLDGAAALLEAQRLRSSPKNFPDATPVTTLGTTGMKASKSNYKTTIAHNFIYCVSSDRQSFVLAAESRSGTLFVMTQDGFVTQSYTEADLTGSFCTGKFGGTWSQASGMNPANTWQTWVGN